MFHLVKIFNFSSVRTLLGLLQMMDLVGNYSNGTFAGRKERESVMCRWNGTSPGT